MGVLKQWLPYVLSGISAGGQYALIAVGYTMVYGILRLINFAHGDIFMVAGLIMVYLSATMPLYAALPAVVILTVALGFAVERCAYKPLRQAPRMSVMISAIGVSYLLQNLAYYVTGGVPKQYPELPWISDTITILGASTKRVTVITPVLTLVLVVALVILIKRTKVGMAMRAASKDFETAQLMGIKINSVISFTLSSAPRWQLLPRSCSSRTTRPSRRPPAPCRASRRSSPPSSAVSGQSPVRSSARSSSASARICSKA